MAAVAGGDAIADLASDLEFDPEMIFRFVADEIRYEPYVGILRGATGTLDARAGNSVDKALLLAALLEVSGLPYRFARGPLDEATTGALIDSTATDVASARRIIEDVLARGREQVRGEPSAPVTGGPLARLYEAQHRAIHADARVRFDLAGSRLDETVTMLETALLGAGIHLPPGGASLPEAEVTDHTWVQMAQGPAWVDLDPTLPATEPGAVLTPASETLALLPDDLRYRVRFDVLVERVEGGQLVTDSVLEHEGFADQLAGAPVAFGHVTPSAFQRLGITIGSLFGGGWIDYRPTLDFGDGGVVADEAVAFPVAGGSSDLFSVEPSLTPGDRGPVEGEATAEWLEVSVQPPGSEATVARRAVFDRLPAVVRHGGTPTVDAVAPIALVDLESTGSVDFPPMRGIEAFAVATGPTSAARMIPASDDGLGTLALAYHDLRHLMGASTVLGEGARTFLDGPNIVSVSVSVDPDATARDQRDAVRFGLDIWHRSHGVLPLTDRSTTAGLAQVMAGVTDHLAERFTMEVASGTLSDVRGTTGVGEIFEAAAAQGVPTLVLHGDVPSGLPFGPEATATIRQVVGAGDVVVVPAEPIVVGDTVRVGWWAIDPTTGETTDTMDDGSGSVMAEDMKIVQTRLGSVRCYGALGLKVAATLEAVTSAVVLYSILSDIATGGYGGACSLLP